MFTRAPSHFACVRTQNVALRPIRQRTVAPAHTPACAVREKLLALTNGANVQITNALAHHACALKRLHQREAKVNVARAR
jgi:hypothetical protein